MLFFSAHSGYQKEGWTVTIGEGVDGRGPYDYTATAV